jgi:hypothetical protein
MDQQQPLTQEEQVWCFHHLPLSPEQKQQLLRDMQEAKENAAIKEEDK